MAIVRLTNDRTGDVKRVRAGFDWVLFLFSGFFGIPLFLRGLNKYGLAMLGLALVILFVNFDEDPALDRFFGFLNALSIGAAFAFGFHGGKMTAQHLLENGWSLTDPDDPEATAAMQKWSLA